MLSITWLDPRTDPADEPAWAVWNTECGTYRIDYDAATDAYTPHVTIAERRDGRTYTQYVAIDAPQSSLEAAQECVNAYHCRQHNLVPVS